jgi:hypothetical protein
MLEWVVPLLTTFKNEGHYFEKFCSENLLMLDFSAIIRKKHVSFTLYSLIQFEGFYQIIFSFVTAKTT